MIWPEAMRRAVSARRETTVAELSSASYDAVIIGGGITGAAVAREAAHAGLRVALIEQGDYASGTSGRSSRLIHGGLRYLKDMRLGLVAASLEEQSALARSAPHLVRPIPFLLPLYRRATPPASAMRLGMGVYRALSPLGAASAHRRLSAAAVARQEPLLASTGLAGGLLNREYVTHDARLVIETILAAREHGAVTANYVARREYIVERNRVVGVLARDMVSGASFDIRSRVVVNATGPWRPATHGPDACEDGRLTLTKGAHALLPRRRLPIRQAVSFPSPRDGRPLFAVPQHGFVYIGTTETPYRGDPADVTAGPHDISYLVEAAASAFPTCRLRVEDVAATWAGVRPLVAARGKGPGRLSRRYTIHWDSAGALSILGGKLTLHRRGARAAVAAIVRNEGLGANSRPMLREAEPLPGAVWPTPPAEIVSALEQSGLAAATVRHLTDTYGSRSARFVGLLREQSVWGAEISEALPHIWAEVVFAIRHEMAVEPEDFLTRRSDFSLRLAAAGQNPTYPQEAPWPASARE